MIRRLFDKLDLFGALAMLGTEKRRTDDYSPADMCLCLLYGACPANMAQTLHEIVQKMLTFRGISGKITCKIN